MTCVSSFPNSKRNRSDSQESDPIDCCVVSMHAPSSLLVYRTCNVRTALSRRQVLRFSLSTWGWSQILLSLVYLLKLAWFCLASGIGELSRIILKCCLLLVLRKLKQSIQSPNTLLFFSLSTLQFAEGFFEITVNCWTGKVPAAASLQKKTTQKLLLTVVSRGLVFD